MRFRLLDAFRDTFQNRVYKHRVSTLGDRIACHLFDDLLDLNRSPKFVSRVASGHVVVNAGNRIKGKAGRRGDGTLGELVPGGQSSNDPDYLVQRGPIATMEIGSETKILATKMIAQIDRVLNDLEGQAHIFKGHSASAITLAMVGVNYADRYTGHEGARSFPAKVPPSREAPEIVRRIEQRIPNHFDEVLILKFKATNRPPYPFEWLDEQETRLLYGSVLTRISHLYEQRF